jgi:uncharacterized oxidoreductase
MGGGIHVMSVSPVATDTKMMRSSRAGAELGWAREAVAEVDDENCRGD